MLIAQAKYLERRPSLLQDGSVCLLDASFRAKFRLGYAACGAVSLIFLALTLYIYLTLPGLRNLHGNIVVGNIVSIFLTTLFLIMMFSAKPESEDVQYLSIITIVL